MRTTTLGQLTVSAQGLGCMGMSEWYGATDWDESIATIHRALDLGVTFIDTADIYGAGHNEVLVGRGIAGRRDEVQLATKFGIDRSAGDRHRIIRGEHAYVKRACEASLTRLGVDHIDLYYLHRPPQTAEIEETVGAMAELVAEGKVRYLGLSEATPAQLEQAASVHPISAVEFEWSLLWRDPEDDVVPAARRLGIGLVPYSPLGRGLLTATLGAADIDGSDFRRADPRFHGPALDRNLRHVAVLRDLAAALGLTPGQLALAWLLAQGPDVVPIPGSRRPERIAENAAAAGVRLGPADLERLAGELPRSGWAGDRHSFAVPVTTRADAG